MRYSKHGAKRKRKNISTSSNPKNKDRPLALRSSQQKRNIGLWHCVLPHRKENRGIGGIFFDQLQHKDIETSLCLLEKTAESYINTYEKIILAHRNTTYTKDDKDFQLYRRGRYVEFNLLFDRGTKFGIESNGRAESILASLPPLVSWPSSENKIIKKKNRSLIAHFNKCRRERA